MYQQCGACSDKTVQLQVQELRGLIGTKEDPGALTILNLKPDFKLPDAVEKLRAGLVRYHGDSERASKSQIIPHII